MYTGLHVKYSLFLSDFKENLILSPDLRKILKYQISWKSIQWELDCSTWTGGRTNKQTDMMKLIVGFRNFANTPKNESHSLPLPSTVQHTNSVQSFNIYESGNTLNNKHKNSYLRDK